MPKETVDVQLDLWHGRNMLFKRSVCKNSTLADIISAENVNLIGYLIVSARVAMFNHTVHLRVRSVFTVSHFIYL